MKNVKKSLIQLDKMNRNVNVAEKKLKIGKLLDESTQISIHGYGKKNHFRNLGYIQNATGIIASNAVFRRENFILLHGYMVVPRI